MLNFHKVSSNISTFIPDFGNMCFLTIFLSWFSYRFVDFIDSLKEPT